MKTLNRFLLAAALTAVASPVLAAPLTSKESTNIEAKERHDFRDVQTENYGGHRASVPNEAANARAMAIDLDRSGAKFETQLPSRFPTN